MRDTLLLGLLNGLARLPLRVNRILGRAVGNIYWHCSKKVRHISLVNLSLCYPEKNLAWQRKIAKSGVINMAITLLESPALWRMNATQLRNIIENPEDFDPIFKMQDEGNGLVLSTPHLGNWELSALFYATHRPVTALYRPPKITTIDQFIRAGRESTGATLVPTNTKGVIALTRTVLSGGAAGILADQEASPGNGLFTPYFATQAYTMSLLPKLAQRKKSPVLIMYIESPSAAGSRKYRLHVKKISDAIYDPDLTVACTAMNRAIEEMIRINPGQYNWAYKRFNVTPGIEEQYRAFKK